MIRNLLIGACCVFIGSSSESSIPEGSFGYPKRISNSDTNQYFWPIKDSLNKRDAFHNAYLYLIYRPFGESNLSIAPAVKEIYRLTYFQTFEDIIIISLTEDSVIVKKGDPGVLCSSDTSTLNEVEKQHFNLLTYKYPIDTSVKIPRQKLYVDSLIKLYPQLLNADYYHRL